MLWQLKVSSDLSADILTNFLEQTSTKYIIFVLGYRKAKFAKKYSKVIISEAIRGMKLKLGSTVHNISLYQNCVFIAIAHVLPLLWQLIFFTLLT